MTQQEIEARALELYPERKRQNKKGTGEYDANLPRRKAYIKGCIDTSKTKIENAIIINGIVYEFIDDLADGRCERCVFYEDCYNEEKAICAPFFTDNGKRFEKVAK